MMPYTMEFDAIIVHYFLNTIGLPSAFGNTKRAQVALRKCHMPFSDGTPASLSM